MGFAAGVAAGTNFMSKLQENERANKVEGRAEDEYEYTKSERARKAAAREAIPKFGLNTDSPVTAPPAAAPAAVAAAPEAPPTSVAATAGTGVPPEAPVGTQLRVAAAQAVPEAAPALGLGTPGGGGPTVPPSGAAPGAQPPASAVPPAVNPETGARTKPAEPLSEEMHMARAMFNYARERDDVAGMNAARADIRTTAMRDYANQAGKMSDDDAFKYVHENLTRMDGMPISVGREGKGGYTMMSWDDTDTRTSKLNSAQLKQLVTADMLMKNGFADEGMKVAAGVNKELNDLISKMNASTQGQATTNNAATHNAISDAQTAKRDAASAANAAAGLNLRRDAAAREKYQNADTWQDKDGNTYKSVLEVGKNGPQMKAFKIGGEDGSLQPIANLPKGLTKVGGSGGGKPAADKEIPKAGTMMSGADGDYQSDGRGGRLSVNAPLPEERAGVLKKIGVSGDQAAKLRWVEGGPQSGENVTFPGATMGYNINDPEQMAQMQKDMVEARTQQTMRTETASRVATEPARRAARTQQMDNLSDPNRFGPGVGLPLLVPQNRRDLYINNNE
jgi:hypothetical protein